jgi:hypothetical protein
MAIGAWKHQHYRIGSTGEGPHEIHFIKYGKNAMNIDIKINYFNKTIDEYFILTLYKNKLQYLAQRRSTFLTYNSLTVVIHFLNYVSHD